MRVKLLMFMPAVVLVIMASCASQPYNLGSHNPENLPEDDLVTLEVFYFIEVWSMDNKQVDWSKGSGSRQIVKIPSGMHTFNVTFNNGRYFTWLPSPVAAQLEKGNSYLLKCTMHKEKEGYRAMYHIHLYNDNKEGDEVTLDLAELRRNEAKTITNYVRYVLNPTMRETGNTVKLENDRYILIYKPDMVYSLTSKETGTTTEGRAGFNMNVQMTEGKGFLFDTDISAMSSDRFLASDYTENAQIVLVPVACTEAEVTYGFERPVELRGSNMSFTITEIQRQ